MSSFGAALGGFADISAAKSLSLSSGSCACSIRANKMRLISSFSSSFLAQLHTTASINKAINTNSSISCAKKIKQQTLSGQDVSRRPHARAQCPPLGLALDLFSAGNLRLSAGSCNFSMRINPQLVIRSVLLLFRERVYHSLKHACSCVSVIEIWIYSIST